MSYRFVCHAALYVAAFFLSHSCFATNPSNAVHLRGSTTLYPLVQKAAEDYMHAEPDAKIVVSAGGTARGYKAILDATADIAMTSGAVSEELGDKIKSQGITLVSQTVAYDAIVAVINPINSVNNLSLKQLKNIFSGRITNWQEVGGRNEPIKVFVGLPSGGITDTWKHLILGENETYTPAGLALPSTGRLQKILSEPYSITYSTLGILGGLPVKILNVEGVSVNDQTIRDGSYVLRVPLNMVTTQKSSIASKKFIEFFLSQHYSLLSDKYSQELTDRNRGEL